APQSCTNGRFIWYGRCILLSFGGVATPIALWIDMDQAKAKHLEAEPASHGGALTPTVVYEEYAPRIYGLARRMLGNDADAEDVTQEVLLQVVRKLHTFRGESAFPTWLHRVTVNAALNYRRKRAQQEDHRTRDPLELFTDEGRHRTPGKRWAMAPEKRALDKEPAQVIEKAIARLPAIYRDVYVLADVEGLPNAEIADDLGPSVMAVK